MKKRIIFSLVLGLWVNEISNLFDIIDLNKPDLLNITSIIQYKLYKWRIHYRAPQGLGKILSSVGSS